MSHPVFDHIDLRVRDFKNARAFYDALMPALGLRQSRITPLGHALYEGTSGWNAGGFFCLEADQSHLPNATRIAFGVHSNADVDNIAAVVQAAGAKNVEGPMRCPEYSQAYYAVFFEDPDGNRLEVRSRT